MRDSKFYNSLHLGIVRNLVCVFILLNVNSSFLFADDWKSDSITIHTEVKPSDSISRGISVFLIGGIGMATGGNFGWIDNVFNIGPAIAVGLEIPFTKSHIFAFELYNHFWMCSTKMDSEYYNDYLKISDKFYSQGGLSTVIKVYLWGSNYDFRISLHLGAVLSSTVKLNSDYRAIDVGFGLYYRISDKFQMNLNRRYMIGEFDLGGGSRERTQNLIMFHICYDLRS